MCFRKELNQMKEVKNTGFLFFEILLMLCDSCADNTTTTKSKEITGS